MDENLVEAVRDSDELDELLAQADLEVPLEHEETRRESGETVVVLHHRDESVGLHDETPGFEDFEGYEEVTVEGHFEDGSLEWVALVHDRLEAPIVGRGVRYEHRDGSISRSDQWIA